MHVQGGAWSLLLTTGAGCILRISASTAGWSPSCPAAQRNIVGEILHHSHIKFTCGVAAARDPEGIFISVSEDGYLRLWDATSRQCLAMLGMPGVPSSCDINSSATLAAVGLRDGRLVVVRIALDSEQRKLETLSCFTLRKPGRSRSSGLKSRFRNTFKTAEEVQVVVFGGDGGNVLAAGSRDNNVYVFRRNNDSWSYVGCGQGHSSFIVSIQISESSCLLQSNDGSHEILSWDFSGEGRRVRLEPHLKKLRDQEWDTWRCLFGYQVAGIWPSGSDPTDVNAVLQSPDKSLLATAGDDGSVRLFKFPATEGSTPLFTCRGHESHVMDLSWVSDSCLLSAGGLDSVILQWRIR